ncbi:unnamed protein product [Arabidopsis halleri]
MIQCTSWWINQMSELDTLGTQSDNHTIRPNAPLLM